jgi:hypothetical protein
VTTSIQTGIAVNRLRKLSRQWDYWNAMRSGNPHAETWTWQQRLAEKECGRIGPAIVALQREIEASRE